MPKFKSLSQFQINEIADLVMDSSLSISDKSIENRRAEDALAEITKQINILYNLNQTHEDIEDALVTALGWVDQGRNQ